MSAPPLTVPGHRGRMRARRRAMDRTGYVRGDVANAHGVPVPADNAPRAAHARDATNGIGPPLPCPEGCTVPEGASRESDDCRACRGCGLLTVSRVLACYPAERAREILAAAMLVERPAQKVPWAELLRRSVDEAKRARRLGRAVVTASQTGEGIEGVDMLDPLTGRRVAR